MRYLVTTHYWFQSSEGFSVEEIDATSPENARQIAALMEKKRWSNFRRARCDVIEIADNEHLAPRRLTWRERLTGQIGYTSVSSGDSDSE